MSETGFRVEDGLPVQLVQASDGSWVRRVSVAPVVGGDLDRKTAVIANGQTVSAAITLDGRLPVTLQMPAVFTGTSITFQSSYDGVAYQPVHDGSGAAISVAVAASRNVTLYDVLQAFLGAKYLKLVSGSAEGAERTVNVVLRPLA